MLLNQNSCDDAFTDPISSRRARDFPQLLLSCRRNRHLICHQCRYCWSRSQIIPSFQWLNSFFIPPSARGCEGGEMGVLRQKERINRWVHEWVGGGWRSMLEFVFKCTLYHSFYWNESPLCTLVRSVLCQHHIFDVHSVSVWSCFLFQRSTIWGILAFDL